MPPVHQSQVENKYSSGLPFCHFPEFHFTYFTWNKQQEHLGREVFQTAQHYPPNTETSHRISINDTFTDV